MTKVSSNLATGLLRKYRHPNKLGYAYLIQAHVCCVGDRKIELLEKCSAIHPTSAQVSRWNMNWMETSVLFHVGFSAGPV